MGKFVETQATSVELAIEKALLELGISRDRAEIEVLSKGGLFSRASVRVTVKDNLAKQLGEFVNGTLERMGLMSRAQIREESDTIFIDIQGEDSSVAIGYRGEALDAFQYLALTFLNERKGDFKKVVVDCEGYREKRRETLTELALRLADKATRLRRKIALEPMNPFERRIIHSALADSAIAHTESEGEEPNRYVVITPIGVELKDKRPIKNGERDHDRRGRDNRGDRRDRSRFNKGDRRERRPKTEEQEAPDGKVYRGYITSDEQFVKPAAPQGPPKYKSFGGKKRF